jgi:nucleotide-binding universal stress UspA family protein
MNFKRILVAINHSPQASSVFDRALSLARQDGAHLTILHCLAELAATAPPLETMSLGGLGFEGTDLGLSQPFYDELQQTESDLATAWLQEYSQKAMAANVLTDYQHHFGAPETLICQVAAESDIDLIVLGWHDRSGIVEFFAGNVCDRVIHHATCSVLVVKDANVDRRDRR